MSSSKGVFLKLLLRSYTNLFNNFTIINENQIAERFNVNTSEVVRLLEKLEQLEIIKQLSEKDENLKKIITFIFSQLE